MRGIGLSYKIKGAHLQGGRESVDEFLGPAGAQRLFQHGPRVSDPALGYVLLRQANLIKLLQNLLLHLGTNPVNGESDSVSCSISSSLRCL
jgi:hypothetical protein